MADTFGVEFTERGVFRAKPKECNMKFAQLNGLQISEDQIKDLQKQIEAQRYTPKAIGQRTELRRYDISGGTIFTRWDAVDGRTKDGSFKLTDKSCQEGFYSWMCKESCCDLIAFLYKCIKDIDNGVLE